MANLVFWQPPETLEALEERVILEAVKFCDNNKQRAADMLGISHQTIYNKLDSYEARNKKYIQGRREEQERSESWGKASGAKLPARFGDNGNGSKPQGR